MHNTISEQQWACLRQMPAGRPLMLQMHWRWSDTPKEEIAAALACADAQVLSRASVDLLTIGDSPQLWSECWLLEYPEPAAAEAHIQTASFQKLISHAEAAELLVATPPHPRVQRLLKAMSQVMRWLPRPRRGAELPASELLGGINPSPQQMQAFTDAAQDSPTHMFNLLRFHEQAQYTDDRRDCSGRRAYEDGYGRVALGCVLRLGGRIVGLGRYRFTLMGAAGEPAPQAWDEIAVLEYPNRQAFIHMLSNPTYLKALQHRHAGLQSTQVWSSLPLTS